MAEHNYQSDDLIGLGYQTIFERFEGWKNCIACIERQALFLEWSGQPRTLALVIKPATIEYVAE